MIFVRRAWIGPSRIFIESDIHGSLVENEYGDVEQ